MDSRIVAKYLTDLKEKSGLTYEAIAGKSERAESTVKNLCSGKTSDPRLDTVAPVIYAMGGSIDEMLNPDKSKDEIKELSISQIKGIYEFQLSEMSKLHEKHIDDIRAHYEQHRQDFKDNVEHRLSDKREIITQKEEHIKSLKKTCLTIFGFALLCAGTLITILILEVLNPSLGWIRF